MRIVVLVAAAIVVVALLRVAPQPKQAFAADDHSARPSSGHSSIGAQAQQQDDDGPDRTELVLWTLAASGAAAVLASIGYVIRKRVGFWPHRPPPRDGSQPEDHH
jgi:hypothetical protein